MLYKNVIIGVLTEDHFRKLAFSCLLETFLTPPPPPPPPTTLTVGPATSTKSPRKKVTRRPCMTDSNMLDCAGIVSIYLKYYS